MQEKTIGHEDGSSKLKRILDYWEGLFDKHINKYHTGEPVENCDSCRMFIQKILTTQAEIRSGRRD